MRNCLLIAASLAAFALTSCSSVSNVAYTEPVETTILNVTVADLDVAKEKVTGTYSWNWNPFLSNNTRKEAAVAEALKTTQADIIVEPVYEFKNRGIFRGGSVTVTGYPATFTNFRAMAPEDAEVIATLKNPVAIIAPEVPTTGPSFLSKIKPFKQPKEPKAEKEPMSSISFLTLTGGPLLLKSYYYEDIYTGGDLGIMYGHHGSKWGWYGHLSFDWHKMDNYSSYNGHYEKSTKMIPTLTFGAIKTLGRNLNLMFGAGIGGAIEVEDYYDYEYQDLYFGVPFEIGLQYHWNKFNVMLGYQYILNTCETSCYNMKPYVGIGFSF